MTGLVTSLGVIVAVVVGICGIAQALRARQHQLAQSYVDRYWQLSDHAMAGGAARRLELDPRYWQLCEDEFEAARLGWLDPHTWPVWHDAIRTALCRSEYHDGNMGLGLCTADDSGHGPWDCPGITAAPSTQSRLSRRLHTARVLWQRVQSWL